MKGPAPAARTGAIRAENTGSKPCQAGQNPYNARIRRPRPGAERTVSANPQWFWCGRASRPVVPCFRLL